MNQPTISFNVFDYNGNTAVVGNASCTLRVTHGTDFEIVPIERLEWSQKAECAVGVNDGYEVEVITLVNPNAMLFVRSDVWTCGEDAGDVTVKVYLPENVVDHIEEAIEQYVEELELQKIANRLEV